MTWNQGLTRQIPGRKPCAGYKNFSIPSLNKILNMCLVLSLWSVSQKNERDVDQTSFIAVKVVVWNKISKKKVKNKRKNCLLIWIVWQCKQYILEKVRGFTPGQWFWTGSHFLCRASGDSILQDKIVLAGNCYS